MLSSEQANIFVVLATICNALAFRQREISKQNYEVSFIFWQYP